MLTEAGKIILMGVALASVWYWVAVLFRITHPDKGMKLWFKIIIPQGIIIAFAVKVLYGFIISRL